MTESGCDDTRENSDQNKYGELSRKGPSESDTQASVIYVEIPKKFSPSLVNSDESFHEYERYEEPVSLKRVLRENGILRIEQAFATYVDEIPDRDKYLSFHFDADSDVNGICQQLNQRADVLHAFPATGLIPPFPLSGNPFDEPLLGTAEFAHLPRNQWYIFRCKIDRAWKAAPKNGFISGKGVVVADIDWGFLTTHQDLGLQTRIKVTHNTTDPMNPNNVSQGEWISHGTAVLGLVGASGNNRKGLAGVSFGADLWAIQAGKKAGTLDVQDWVSAIDFVRRRDSEGQRKVIMLEVETKEHDNIETHPIISKAIIDAIADDVIVCVAAGNGNRDAGINTYGVPIPLTGSIVVGATDFDVQDNPIHPRSNHGLRVTVYAPGAEFADLTCSSDGNESYTNRFGRTSGATPKVAGTVALMLEVNSKLTSCEIKDILRETGSPMPASRNKPAGIFLNAEAAVREALRRV